MSRPFTHKDYVGDHYRLAGKVLVSLFSQPYRRMNEKKMHAVKTGAKNDVDAEYLKDVFIKCFGESKVDVALKNQHKKHEVIKYLQDLGKSEICHDYDCFLFVFLTFLSDENYGNSKYRDERILLYDEYCDLQEIYDTVKTIDAMHMKPKIFLVQADDFSLLETERFYKGDENEKGEGVTKQVKIPQDADRLIIMSDIPQRLAKEDEPSFLIKAFADCIKENSKRPMDGKDDILTQTTLMNGKIKEQIKQLQKKKVVRANDMTVAMVSSTLTKLLKL